MTDLPETPVAAETWQSPPHDLALLDRDVHVWHVHPLERPAPSTLALLSSDELATAAAFKFDKDRDRFAACRSALRRILGQYANKSPEQLRFEYGPHGKPAMLGSDLHFNVSHTHDHGLIAVSRRPVGVDIESVETTSDPIELSQRFFTLREADAVRNAPIDRRRELFLAFWTRKEALMKATGTGLSEPLDRFDVSETLDRSQWWQIKDLTSGAIWSIRDLRPSSDVIAAVATEDAPNHLLCWR